VGQESGGNDLCSSYKGYLLKYLAVCARKSNEKTPRMVVYCPHVVSICLVRIGFTSAHDGWVAVAGCYQVIFILFGPWCPRAMVCCSPLPGVGKLAMVDWWFEFNPLPAPASLLR
jgi:hypothetical protein